MPLILCFIGILCLILLVVWCKLDTFISFILVGVGLGLACGLGIKEIGAAIHKVTTSWGHPHLHGGVGIRRLGPAYFECRTGLRVRLVFKALAPNLLHFVFLGNHDEIRRFLKSNG